MKESVIEMADTSSAHMQLRSQFHNLVRFVPPSKTTRESKVKVDTHPCSSNETGAEVRSFYEQLLSEPSSNSSTDCQQQTCQKDTLVKDGDTGDKKKHEQKISDNLDEKTSSVSSELLSGRQVHKLLMYSQNGDLKNLRKCLKEGTSIESRDNFGWTPLMCAVHAGHIEIVKYLLRAGADTETFDSQGRTPYSIAKYQRHKAILEILQNSHEYTNPQTRKSPEKEVTKFFCVSCKAEFNTSELEHSRSMIHLITSNRRVKGDPFLIPESNKGYRLMRKSGWDGESGLGPEGQGKKYPIKTVLKKDRSCLGSGKTQKPKVTHFQKNDRKAIENFQKPRERIMSVRTMSKKARLAKERKNKRWERDMRLYFNTD